MCIFYPGTRLQESVRWLWLEYYVSNLALKLVLMAAVQPPDCRKQPAAPHPKPAPPRRHPTAPPRSAQLTLGVPLPPAPLAAQVLEPLLQALVGLPRGLAVL